MVDAPDRALDQRVRDRLRQLRTERGLTLQQVADVAHIDVSTLSRLEAGKRRLAIDHLPGLASALSVSVDDLLAPTTAPDPRVRNEPRTHHGITVWPLTHRGPAGGLQAYKFLVLPGREDPPNTLHIHEGHDWMYVLSGRMHLILGEDHLEIEAGEAVEFSTLTPHWFGAIDEPLELIAIFSPQGEQIHLRT